MDMNGVKEKTDGFFSSLNIILLFILHKSDFSKQAKEKHRIICFMTDDLKTLFYFSSFFFFAGLDD